MAISKNYCLYDHVASVFLKTLSFENDGKAIQWFTTIVNQEDNTQAPAMYPESFSLYRVDDFDDKKGMYVPRDLENHMAANKDLDINSLDRLPKQIITGVEVADKVNMKFTMKQLLTALKSDLLNTDIKDTNVVELTKEANV